MEKPNTHTLKLNTICKKCYLLHLSFIAAMSATPIRHRLLNSSKYLNCRGFILLCPDIF